MKKLLLLGGSSQQIVAIEKAKELGYYTILCDYLPDNPGQYYADKFYCLSTTDFDAILDVSQKEEIDGIIAYASDPAAPTAAFVAEKLGLHGNPLHAVNTFCNKDLFREFLNDNGFHTPMSQGFTEVEEALNSTEDFTLPVIVKPVDSSGSKGVTVVRDRKDLDKAVVFAFSFSRSNRIIIEEFIEKDHKYLIGGDIFVLNGEVKVWGLMNCHRDERVNALVPVGKSYPVQLEDERLEFVKDTLQSMITTAGIIDGPLNVELVVDKNNCVWPIDIGPRSGGNMIPDLLNDIFGIDVITLSLKLAMNEDVSIDTLIENKYYATHNLHSDRDGVLRNITFSKEIEKYIVRKSIYVSIGDRVEYFNNSAKALGIVFFHFDDENTMNQYLENINDYIMIDVQ